MNAERNDESIVDYTGFDFAGLWSGREKVSEVERSIVSRALASGDRRRILEVGTGFGRLLGTVSRVGAEVVATDLDLASLRRPSVEESVRPGVVRVAANLYHLPFVDGAFTGATMVRVHHHLLDPVSALAEMARVLRPGSSLVVSYQPTPSLGTLVNDVQRALRSSRTEPYRSVSFARPPVLIPPKPFPIRIVGKKEFAREAGRAGFVLGKEVGAGFEEYSPLRRLPSRLFVRLGTTLGRAPGFPTRFVAMVREGHADKPLPEISGILACPRCGLSRPRWSESEILECDRCAFVGTREEDVLDLRYVPPQTRRWGPAS